MHKLTKVLTLALAMAQPLPALAGGGSRGTEPRQQAPRNFAATDACLTANAHKMYGVPPGFGKTIRLTSGSGAYHYLKKGNCDRFIADVFVGPIVNSNAPGSSDRIDIEADGFDVPSSAYFGAEIPTTETDCSRFVHDTSYYRRSFYSTSFQWLGSKLTLGTWDVDTETCELESGLKGSDLYDTRIFNNQNWVYRVTTKLILRSSAQEVAVRISPTILSPH